LLAVGVVGGLAVQGIGVPAGMIVGALLASGCYRLAGGDPGPWRGRYGRVGRLLLGTVIGAAFGPDVIAPLKAALLPMLLLITAVVGMGLGLGYVLSRFTRLDTTTALISVVPGGLPAMTAMAEDVGADATVVAAIHFARLVTVVLVVPALVPLLAAPSSGTAIIVPLDEAVGLWPTVAALTIGLIGGLLALRGGVISGDLIGRGLALRGHAPHRYVGRHANVTRESPATATGRTASDGRHCGYHHFRLAARVGIVTSDAAEPADGPLEQRARWSQYHARSGTRSGR